MTANSIAINRLTNDYKQILGDPLPNALARPAEENIFEWHYVIFGAAGTPYEGGYYHGKLVFPKNFPFSPPTILMVTPSGRFYPNQPLCFSISDHHPESWNPAWTVSSIIMGIVSFMNDDKEHTLGSMRTDIDNRQKYSKKSKKFNIKNSEFRRMFPDLVSELKKQIKEEKKFEHPTEYASSSCSDLEETNSDEFEDL